MQFPQNNFPNQPKNLCVLYKMLKIGLTKSDAKQGKISPQVVATGTGTSNGAGLSSITAAASLALDVLDARSRFCSSDCDWGFSSELWQWGPPTFPPLFFFSFPWKWEFPTIFAYMYAVCKNVSLWWGHVCKFCTRPWCPVWGQLWERKPLRAAAKSTAGFQAQWCEKRRRYSRPQVHSVWILVLFFHLN